MSAFEDGVYRLYRLYPRDGEVEQVLTCVFGIFGGTVIHLEDRDGVLDGALPEGPLTARMVVRLRSLEDCGYWRLVGEDEIERGLHPDLAEAPDGAQTGRPASRRSGP